MQKSDVIAHYKTQIAVAEALEISPAAISKWPELVPELRAIKLAALSGGQLKYDPELYKKNKAA